MDFQGNEGNQEGVSVLSSRQVQVSLPDSSCPNPVNRNSSSDCGVQHFPHFAFGRSCFPAEKLRSVFPEMLIGIRTAFKGEEGSESCGQAFVKCSISISRELLAFVYCRILEALQIPNGMQLGLFQLDPRLLLLLQDS